MFNKLIAVFLILIFLLLIAIAIWSFVRIHKMGMLALFLRSKWLGSLLSGLFVILFIASGVAMLMDSAWAVPAMRYTIYGWMLYVWLYGLKKIVDMILMLRYEKATSLSQFMGRSKFFDGLMEKTIAFSQGTGNGNEEKQVKAHAVSDLSWEEVLNDETLFKDRFHNALRKKIRRRMIGLLVHMLLFVVILALLS